MDASNPPAVECPACGAPAHGRAGVRLACTHCGSSLAAAPAGPPAGLPPEGVDDLGVAVLSVDRLRSYLNGPPTPAERSPTHRFVDELSQDRWRR